MVDKIKIRGARVHNLKNVNVDVPLNKIVGIAGVSGSGKSSLALGVLYAEGSRRYLEALANHRWLWACCMPKVRAVIWKRSAPTHAAA